MASTLPSGVLRMLVLCTTTTKGSFCCPHGCGWQWLQVYLHYSQLPRFCFWWRSIPNMFSLRSFGDERSKEVQLPQPELLPYGETTFLYFFTGDDAFSLRTWMIKPYLHRQQRVDQRVFNYYLSRSQSTVENAFGILSARFFDNFLS